MKKTVIKRRKRVPAASGAGASANTSPTSNARLTEQAAAEALVSVSRVQERASGEESGGLGADDDEGDDDDEPRRKRAKRGANGGPPASLLRRRSARTKVPTREPTPEDKDEDDDVDAGAKRRRKGTQRDILLAESRAGSLSRSSSRAAFHIDRYGRGYTANSPSLHSANHVGGFDLPPLNAALAAPEMSHMVLNGSRAFFPTSAGYVGPPRDFGPSYMRSGSAAPSRAHSPSNAYVLPPLHYAASGMYGNGSPHHRSSPSSPPIPSHAELEKHFMDLSKEKSRLEEMLARTEWLMQGVRRGMDEMRERELAIALSQHAAQRSRQPTPSRPVSASPPRSPHQVEGRPASQPPASIPLHRHRPEPSAPTKDTVWNVVPIETSA
jgi:GATA-binding protein